MLTKEELEFRRTKIGASDIAGIIGVSKHKTRYDVWEEKVLGPSQKKNGAMSRGDALEPIARHAFEKETGYLVSPQRYVHATRPWQMASLDGITFDGEVIVEIKAPNMDDHDLALAGKIPPHYKPQPHWQMDVVPTTKKAFYASYHPDSSKPLAIVEIYKDEDYINELIQEGEDFFLNHILTQNPPEMTDKDYPVIEDEQMFELRHRYEEAILQVKHWDTKIDELKNSIKSHVGNRSARAFGMKITKSMLPGRVNYKEIPELREVDLTAYRGPPIEQWRITIEKK
jgi:putative phage-type endonuclease